MEASAFASWPSLFANSALIAALGAAGAAALGSAQALLLEAFAVRARGALRVLLMLPLLLPAAALTTALHLLCTSGPLRAGVSGSLGAAAVGALECAPIVLWGVARAIAALPAAERDSVRATLSPWRGALCVILPRVLPAAGAMTLLSFLLLFPRSEVPGYAGVQTVGTAILSAFTSGAADPSASHAAWWLLAATAALVLVGLAPFVRRLARAAPRPLEQNSWDSGRTPREPTALVPTLLLGACVVGYLLPIAALLLECGDLSMARTRLPIAGLGIESARALIIAALLALAGWRLAERRSTTLWVVVALPLFLPGSVPALVLLDTVDRHLPVALHELPLLLSIAQAVRFAGVALFFGALAHASLPQAEREAAQLLPPAPRRWRVYYPRALPILATGTIVTTLLILGEVECVTLLAPPGHPSPVLELHQFLHFRYDADAARLALLLGVTGAAITALLARFGRDR